MGTPLHAYFSNNIYRVLANRLMKRHRINLASHIDEILYTGVRLGQGITFRPVDSDKLKAQLKMPAFAHDNRNNFCEALAAAATKGEGYREIGSPSLHFDISPSKCYLHLDSYGFVAIGPDGKKYYNLDFPQHIIDELGWATFIKMLDQNIPIVGQGLGRFHPILPNSRNRYGLSVGGRFVVAEGNKWSLGIDRTISARGEKKTMANLEVWNW